MQKLIATSLLLLIQLLLWQTTAHANPSLQGVRSFGYQLQNATVSGIVNAPYDLVVIDYSKDGSDGEAFTRSEIAAMKRSGKKVLAYLSIGEAEDYRYYFNSSWVRSKSGAPCSVTRTARAPAWLDDSNPEWCGNYKVRYWMKEWQQLLYGTRRGPSKSYLDRIIDAGFDGAYLDIVDGYEYWRGKTGADRRVSAAHDMALLVVSLGHYARTVRGKKNFVLVPQNGAEILGRITPQMRARYLRAIQGIGAEDTFYFGPNDEDNPLDPQPARFALKRFLSAGKKVFAVDYLLDNDKISDFAGRACEIGFIPQVATRALDTLDTQVLDGCNCISSISGSVC